MFGRSIKIFRLFVFDVRVDASWVLVAIVFAWCFTLGVFPYVFSGLRHGTYWWMGVTLSLGLFASIVVHEFCHSLVARRNNLQMKGITLFIFGGVAQIEEGPGSPKV